MKGFDRYTGIVFGPAPPSSGLVNEPIMVVGVIRGLNIDICAPFLSRKIHEKRRGTQHALYIR